MTRLKLVLHTVIFLVAVLSFRPACWAAANDTATIIFVRHTEKSALTGDVPLSSEGRERAELLAWMLKPAGITHIFSSQLLRARETAASIERTTNLKAEVISVEEDATLIKRLKDLPTDAVALVVSHSSTIPKLVDKLGTGKIAPIAEDDYDRLIVVMRISDRFQAVSLQYQRPSTAQPRPSG